MKEKLRITLVRSPIGHPHLHRRIVRALGLHHTYQSLIHEDVPVIRGMVKKVSYLLKVEKISQGECGETQ
jgi:large subunit ribosomal protein L30